MKKIEIQIIKNQVQQTATLEVDRKTRTLIFSTHDGLTKKHTAEDLYQCFGLLRADFPEITFLCKGAKINVHPSRMSSQMSAGLVAYEVRKGYPTDEDDVVRIFDYEENDLTNDIKKQENHYKLWIESITPTNRLSTEC
ncbi:hypothetical protein HU755_17575 [Pseudomonas sp. SWRI111]|uniref:hypothetical protein n=1 Tax=Pseudomonas sp. SWRI111 TaxID=2745507 RepID=UPI001644E278|nr:hypothetical protein [Pseudomonas sp. SWRI111]